MSEDQEEKDQSQKLAERDKFNIKYGIEIALRSNLWPKENVQTEITDALVDKIYWSRIKHQKRGIGI